MTFMQLSRRWFLRILGSSTLISHIDSKISFLSKHLAAASGKHSQIETYKATSRNVNKVQSQKPDENVQMFRWSGGQYKHDVENFISEFLNHYGSKRPYPIANIFQIFPFQVTEAGKASDLIKRGDITFAGGAASNTGDSLDVEFKDQSIGRLSIVFSQKMAARITDASLKAFNLQFDVPNRVPVVFYELDPAHEMGPNQRLESISFNPDVVSYTLCELGHENQKVRIEIDLTRTESKPQPSPARKKLSGVISDGQDDRVVPASLAVSGLAAGQQPQNAGCEDDTRPQVGGFRCGCCGGRAGNGRPCGPGQAARTLEDHPITFVNESGVPLLVYYFIGTAHPFYCQWLVNDGPIENGDRKSYVIPAKAAGWFRFQLTSEGAGCPDTTAAGDRLNVYSRWAYGGVATEEVVAIYPMP